ncbi:MAG: hypothetical protein DI535_00010 [Citrobacter freundii]|nr:MAG: hypothetical protein DI535_00010 [Citrobacter freundii]
MNNGISDIVILNAMQIPIVGDSGGITKQRSQGVNFLLRSLRRASPQIAQIVIIHGKHFSNNSKCFNSKAQITQTSSWSQQLICVICVSGYGRLNH